MRCGVKIELALHSGGHSDFNFQRVARTNFCRRDERSACFTLLQTKKVRGGEERCSFEFQRVLPQQGGGFTGHRKMPGRLTVIGENFGLAASDELHVVAIGSLSIERKRTGFSVGSARQRSFEAERLQLGQLAAATGGFDVLLDDFPGFLGAQWWEAREERKKERGAAKQEARVHGVIVVNAQNWKKFHGAD